MRRPPTTVVALGLGALLLAVGSSAAARTVPKTRTTPGRIEALAMDGSRVAYDVAAGTGPKARCNAVFAWDVARNTMTRVSGRETCSADNTSTGAGVRELALAGGRAAWIVNQGGNTESSDYLYTSPVTRAGERVVASARRTGDVDSVLTGNWIGGLVGSGSFLAVDHWATDSTGAVTTAHLQRVGARLGDLAEGAGTLLAQATDGKQVAVLHPDGTVGLYSTRGVLLRAVRPQQRPTEVALRGDYLATLTTADTLQVYNSHSGRLLHTWPVAHHARSLDVSSGLATYAAPFPGGGYARVVHIRRLKSGRDRVLLTTPPALAAVRLEPAGLAYAFNRVAPGTPGTVAFVPMGRIVRALRSR